MAQIPTRPLRPQRSTALGQQPSFPSSFTHVNDLDGLDTPALDSESQAPAAQVSQLPPELPQQSTLPTGLERQPSFPSSLTHVNDVNGLDQTKLDSESQAPANSGYYASYISPMVVTSILLISPWIFYEVVRSHDGIVASPHFSVIVRQNPQTVTFLVTHFGTLFAAIVALLFSTAIVRFSQKWIVNRGVELFHISFLTTLKTQRFSWDVRDLSTLASRWHFMVIVIACFTTFYFVPSGISALLAPIPFNKTGTLTGTELDLTSSAPDCVAWLQIPRIQPTCNWFTYNGLHYTSCLAENQLIDAIEAGRGNIFALLSNNTQSQVFNQLGSRDGLRFLGPMRGVLPLGPNGVPAFNTLAPSRLSDPAAQAGIISYQYTLHLQGLYSQIQCQYATSSPVSFNKSADGIYRTLGFCPPGQDVFPVRPLFIHIVSDHTLGMWACGLGNRDPNGHFTSYLLYLRGYLDYDRNIGNITCTVSSIQPAVFPITFSNQISMFSASKPTQVATNSPTDLILQSIMAVSSLVSEGQSFASNAIAESVITLGVRSFGLSPFSQDPKYLQIFEAMLQGMIEYEATYIRLITTANNTGTSIAPRSCLRTINGSALYRVTGWHFDDRTSAFLIPNTAINLASLILLLVAMYMGEQVLYSTDPTDPRSLLRAQTQLSPRGDRVTITLVGGGNNNFWKDLWKGLKGYFIGTAKDVPEEFSKFTLKPTAREAHHPTGDFDPTFKADVSEVLPLLPMV